MFWGAMLDIIGCEFATYFGELGGDHEGVYEESNRFVVCTLGTVE